MKNSLYITFSFLFLSQFLFSQENKIIISPNSLLGTSSVSVSVKEKGIYDFKIKNEKGEEFFNKKIHFSNTSLLIFKHDFKKFKKGKYTFLLVKNNTLIMEKDVIKKGNL